MNASKNVLRGIEHLGTAECWRLIEAGSFGRLAVVGLDGTPDVFPLNYTVHGGSLYIRSAPGTKLMAITVHPVAAFEVDGEDDEFHWSVVLRGTASRVAMDKEIRESGVHSLASDSPTGKHHFIRVTPSSVSGRRFAQPARALSLEEDRSILDRLPAAADPARPDGSTIERTPHAEAQPRAQRPLSIAHLPPR